MYQAQPTHDSPVGRCHICMAFLRCESSCASPCGTSEWTACYTGHSWRASLLPDCNKSTTVSGTQTTKSTVVPGTPLTKLTLVTGTTCLQDNHREWGGCNEGYPVWSKKVQWGCLFKPHTETAASATHVLDWRKWLRAYTHTAHSQITLVGDSHTAATA